MSDKAPTQFSDGVQPVPPHRFAAIAGRWTFDDRTCRYTGPEDLRHPRGLALAAGRFRDGTVEATVRLSRTERTSGGILLFYQSTRAPYAGAALGAFDKAYSIFRYMPDFGWRALVEAGSLSNLQADRDYRLRVRVFGQRVQLSIDDVDVLDTLLGEPLEGTGIGLHAWDDAEVAFSDIRVERSRPSIFVIMPFKEPFDTLYREVINPIASDSGFDIQRVDEIPGPGVILDDIQQQIEQSHAVVADITDHNPNVFYELGYAHALRKPAILLVRRAEGERMPFDIRGYRAIFYDDTIGGKRTVERNVRQHLNAILRGGPVS